MRLSRRQVAIGAGTVALGIAGGLFACVRRRRPPLGRHEHELIARAWEGLDPRRVLDTHCHLVGLGTGGTGCWVNPSLMTPMRPQKYAQFQFYISAAEVTDLAHADAQYLARLRFLLRDQSPRGRLLLLPFAFARREDGTEDREMSEFYVPNEYALSVARAEPQLFAAAGSVHPYAPDAVERLRACRQQGAVAVKWLPNAMNIDPGSPRCDGFYGALAGLGMPLITHAGEEQAVDSKDLQRLGSPLRLRRALDHGVKVIIAHCASLGRNPDLDRPEGDAAPNVENFDLFLRLMGEKRYEGRLFADVSAMTQYNRCERPLREILRRPELHHRLVNGSDYPLPAIDPLVRTGKLLDLGYIDRPERAALNVIYAHNPLLFDFVLKRTLRVRDGDRRFAFADAVFMPPAGLFPA